MLRLQFLLHLGTFRFMTIYPFQPSSGLVRAWRLSKSMQSTKHCKSDQGLNPQKSETIASSYSVKICKCEVEMLHKQIYTWRKSLIVLVVPVWTCFCVVLSNSGYLIIPILQNVHLNLQMTKTPNNYQTIYVQENRNRERKLIVEYSKLRKPNKSWISALTILIQNFFLFSPFSACLPRAVGPQTWSYCENQQSSDGLMPKSLEMYAMHKITSNN